MSQLKDVFKTDVTRTISPVIYFHEDSPEKLSQEVSEYIITGGYDDGTKDGIHEQYVKLMTGIRRELNDRATGLPACWISGFYGSGKSGFAKLLGLALDGRSLADGTPLSEALLARDESPKQEELRRAWQALTDGLESLAVVFDIGNVARDGESVHSAARRMVARHLGYCPHKVQAVAEYELELEKDGHYQTFLESYQQEFGRSWDEGKKRGLVVDDFSRIMHRMFPEQYDTPQDWDDAKASRSGYTGSSVDETVQAITEMLEQRAPGKTVFLVIDEISQYIHGETQRMLHLQSFIAALGQKLKGRVWLLATGQQKLEDDSEGSDLPKLKGRFPEHLRAHLSPANIRDVVHRRLLKKNAQGEAELSSLYQQHNAKLRNNAFGGEFITESEFLEVYPMLPGQVDLLMRISSNLRARSSRMKGDDHGIRGLLQLLGELFREKRLGELPLGHLVTIDHIYDVQATTLDSDIQNTMARLLTDPEVKSDPWSSRVAKAVAMLEVVSEAFPTSEAMIAKCLYSYLGEDNPASHVQQALIKLVDLNYLMTSGEQGYKIQSSAGQQWVSRRDYISVPGQAICDEVREVLKRLLGRVERPKLKGLGFAVAATFTDGKAHNQDRLVSHSDQSVVPFEFAFFPRKDDREQAKWINWSSESSRKDTIVWLNGESRLLQNEVKALLQSRLMVAQNAPKRNALSEGERSCLNNEEQRRDTLGQRVEKMVAECYQQGHLYFRGKVLDQQKFGTSFTVTAQKIGEEILPQLYQHFIAESISAGELEQLFLPQLASLSQKFYGDGLGLLEMDSGKAVARCNGEVPRRVLELIKDEKGVSGAELLRTLGAPPYGYYSDIVIATVLGLLRGGFVKLQTTKGVLTSYQDPGCKETFTKTQEFKRATIEETGEVDITERQRVRFLRFFADTFGESLESENETIVNAVYRLFPQLNGELNAFFTKLNKLPTINVRLPETLEKLPDLLEKCRLDRRVRETLRKLDKHLLAITEGVSHLRQYDKLLHDEAVAALKEAADVRACQWRQLQELGCEENLWEAGRALEAELGGDKPWDELSMLKSYTQKLKASYREARDTLLSQQIEMFEAERQRFRTLDGFSKLSPDQATTAMRPFYVLETPTDVEAVSPDLVALRDTPAVRLAKATEQATQNLDQALAEIDDRQTLPFDLNLSGKVLSNEAEVNALLDTLRERLMAQLKQDKVKVRLK